MSRGFLLSTLNPSEGGFGYNTDMNSYSTEIRDSIRSYLDSQEWKYAFDEQYGCFYLNISLQGKPCKTKMVINISDAHYQVSASLVHPVPDEILDDMRKVLNRINNDLLFGHFEVTDENEIRYRATVFLWQDLPGNDMIRKSLLAPICAVSHYADLIADVRQGRMSADAAINVLQTSKASRMN